MNMPKHRDLCLVIVCASALTLCACSGQSNDSANATPSPTPDNPVTRPASLEREFQAQSVGWAEAGEPGLRTEARQAVTEFVKKNLEGWNIKGMSSQVYPGYAFSIDADLEKADTHMVLTFDVRKFFPESGDAYWLAVPENKYRLDRLHKLSDVFLRKQLRKTEEQLEETRSASEQP